MADNVETLPFQNAKADQITITKVGGIPVEDTATTPEANTPEEGSTTPTPTPPATPEGAETGSIQTPKDTETPEGGQEPPTGAPEEYTEDQFHEDVNTLIANSTGGQIKKLDDITAIIAENKRLNEALKHKEPDFPNEALKEVYNLAKKVVGAEVPTARRLFHVMSLDLQSMTPKDKLFEAFYLDRPNLTREDAIKRFEAMYEQTYSDLENNLVQLDAHDLAIRNAETKLKDHQKALEDAVKQSSNPAPQGPTQEQQREVETQLQSALAEFGGVSLKFDDSRYGTLNIPMDKGKAQEFMEILKNPHSMIDRIADTCRDAQGNLDLKAYTREMYLLFDRDRISQEERDHLMKLGKVAQIQEQKNTPKKDLKEEATTPPKKTFQESFISAVKGAGMAN